MVVWGAAPLSVQTACTCVTISSSDGRTNLAAFLFFFALALVAAGLFISMRTESAQAVKRTWASESANWRALRRLSVRARKATSLASAAFSSLSPLSAPSMVEQPPSAMAVRRASAKALRATGLSFRTGGFHIRAYLEPGLEQGLGAVSQHPRRAAVGRRDAYVVRDDDALEARDIGQELSDLIVLADHG